MASKSGMAAHIIPVISNLRDMAPAETLTDERTFPAAKAAMACEKTEGIFNCVLTKLKEIQKKNYFRLSKNNRGSRKGIRSGNYFSNGKIFKSCTDSLGGH